jgi:hypothetical protein
MPQPVDDDATIVLKKPVRPAQAPRRVPLWMIAVPVVAVLTLAGGWTLWPTAPKPPAIVAVPPAAAPAIVLPPAAAPPDRPAFRIEAATESDILNHVPPEGAPDPTIFRFSANPHILVLDFATLRDQGLMLNRVAALIEKAGLPHDRLLNDADLDEAIRAGGDTPETFYYGHDYGVPALALFFALADRDQITLTDGEQMLRRLLDQEGWFAPGAHGGLISIPQIGADEHVTRTARATILHHELSHGEYFANPAYVAFVHHFWTETLTVAERERIRRHLHTLGYDSSLEEVMENEAQAYLMFTDLGEFFSPDMIGMSKARLTELRTTFYHSMPVGWLRDSLGQTLNSTKTATTGKP